MKRTRMLVLLAIVTVVLAIVTNIATNQIPEWLQRYLWLSWPLLALLVGLLIYLTHKTSEEPAPPPPPEVDETSYYQALSKRYKTLDLDALTPPQREEYLQLQLRAVFVEQSVRENPPPIELPKEILEKLQSEGEIEVDDLPEGLSVEEIRALGDRYYKNSPIPVIDVLATTANQHIIILGDPGSGKSTLARYVMLSLVDRDGDRRIRQSFKLLLPVLIELRTFNALRDEHKCDTFLEFLEYLGKTEGWNLTQGAFHERLSAKGAMVIFDGLDEIFDPQDRERVSQAIVGFAQTYPKTRILVTSRIVGYQRRILTEADFSHYTLQDLNRDQVASFISRWYDLALADRPDDANRRKERILQSFDQSASVRQLAGNPMLLTIMAIIGKHQELPRERWKLYEHAVSVLIEHWDVRRHLESLNVDAPFMGEDDKKELLRRLAYSMQAGSGGLKGNYIHRDQLQQEFQNYLRERYTLPPDRATTISKLMIEQFRKRNFILSLYGASVYGFVHRAFLEYFCATAFTYKFEKTRQITIDQLAIDVFERHREDESWNEVLRLICGMVDERFAGQLVMHLLTSIKLPSKDPEKMPAGVELALRCLGELRNLNLVVDATNLTLEAIFDTFVRVTPNALYSPVISKSLSKMVSAILPIAPNWPNKAKLADLLKQFKPSDRSWVYELQFGEFVGAIGAGVEAVRQELMACARSHDANLRALWPEALAARWPDDPNTMSLLKNQILLDPVAACRRSAANAYRHLAMTPENVSFMRGVLEKDPDGSTRFAALNYLGKSGDPSLIPLLVLYLSDPDFLTRFGAFRAVELHITDEVAFSAIVDYLPKEDEDWMRSIFYKDVVNARGDDLRVRDLLLKQAVDDDSEDSRSEILSILAEKYGDDPKVHDLLQARSTDDPSEDVRNMAKELLPKA